MGPAINIGSVYVVDTRNENVREISGFATNEVEVRGCKRAEGHSGVSIGDGLVYVGDVAAWQSSCCEDCPHGLSIDQESGYLFVACSTRVEVLECRSQRHELSSIDTGDGVDDLNYSPATHMLYVGAAKDARLTVARVDSTGKLSHVAVVRSTNALATKSSRRMAWWILRTRSSEN